MAGFVAGVDRGQATLLPECLEDWVDESNPIRVIDAFVDALDLRKLGFEGMDPAEIGRPAYHPSARGRSLRQGGFRVSGRGKCLSLSDWREAT